MRDFHGICKMCITFQVASAVKIWTELIKGLWSYGDFNLRWSGFPKFSVPLNGETMRQTQNVLEIQEGARGSLSLCRVWWASD